MGGGAALEGEPHVDTTNRSMSKKSAPVTPAFTMVSVCILSGKPLYMACTRHVSLTHPVSHSSRRTDQQLLRAERRTHARIRHGRRTVQTDGEVAVIRRAASMMFIAPKLECFGRCLRCAVNLNVIPLMETCNQQSLLQESINEDVP
jgi:hypothetical protein